MLEKIKLLLGIAEDDEKYDDLLNLLISLCKSQAVDFCNLKEYSSKLDSAVIEMVIERYNKRGTEGVTSVSSNGISESYIDDYSQIVKAKLIKNRKIRIVGNRE